MKILKVNRLIRFGIVALAIATGFFAGRSVGIREEDGEVVIGVENEVAEDVAIETERQVYLKESELEAEDLWRIVQNPLGATRMIEFASWLEGVDSYETLMTMKEMLESQRNQGKRRRGEYVALMQRIGETNAERFVAENPVEESLSAHSMFWNLVEGWASVDEKAVNEWAETLDKKTRTYGVVRGSIITAGLVNDPTSAEGLLSRLNGDGEISLIEPFISRYVQTYGLSKLEAWYEGNSEDDLTDVAAFRKGYERVAYAIAGADPRRAADWLLAQEGGAAAKLGGEMPATPKFIGELVKEWSIKNRVALETWLHETEGTSFHRDSVIAYAGLLRKKEPERARIWMESLKGGGVPDVGDAGGVEGGFDAIKLEL